MESVQHVMEQVSIRGKNIKKITKYNIFEKNTIAFKYII